MAPVLLINGDFMQPKQHHKYLVMMADVRLKDGELMDSVSNNNHTKTRYVQEIQLAWFLMKIYWS